MKIDQFNSQLVMFNSITDVFKIMANEMETMLADINIREGMCIYQVCEIFHMLFQDFPGENDEIIWGKKCVCDKLLEEILNNITDFDKKFLGMQIETKKILNKLHEFRCLMIMISKISEKIPWANYATVLKLTEMEINLCMAEKIVHDFEKNVCMNKSRMQEFHEIAMGIRNWQEFLFINE